MFKYFSIILVFVALCSSEAIAQSKGASFEIQHQAREIERRAIIAKNLDLTETEEKAFWNKYDQYRLKVKKAEKVRLGLIGELSENLVEMSEKSADSLVARASRLDVDTQKLKEKHLRSLRPVLGGAKIFKYYQIETKLDATFKHGWTRKIPLVLTGNQKLDLISKK